MTQQALQALGGRHRKLGEILLADHRVTNEQLEQALEVQRSTRQRLGSVMIKMGFIADNQIAAALANQLNLPLIDLEQQPPDPSAVASVVKELAAHHGVVPYKLEGKILTLVMADPLNVQAEDSIRDATGYFIRPAVAPETQIFKFLERFYSDSGTPYDLLGQISRGDDDVISIEEGPTSARELLEASEFDSVIKAVNAILSDGVRRGASDIHLEPYEQSVRLRYRMDGVMQQVALLPLQAYPAVVSRIKILANLDISENRRPQDGSFKAIVGHRATSFRISTLRTGYGEKVVIRILDNSASKTNHENLGLLPRDWNRLEMMLTQTQGMILVTGPTGSGKTTTLYSCLNYLKSDAVNIVTVEDPIEYQLNGINQVQVDEKAGVSFASALRSILRQDPNVVMVGEIRDKETAEIAVRAAMTGHLVLATLHTNDACQTPARLMDMGVEPYLLGVSLIGVLGQRLVRRLCPFCSEQEGRIVGCPHCHESGYQGRMGVYEILTMDSAVRQVIHNGANSAEIEAAARRNGFRTMMEDAQAKVEMGWTNQEQVIAAFGKSMGEEVEEPPALNAPTASIALADTEPVETPPFTPAFAFESPQPDVPAAPSEAIAPAPAPPPLIRVQIGMERMRLAAMNDTDLLAAQTYNQGIKRWQESLSAAVGVTTEKLLTLMETFGGNGHSPFSDAQKQVVSPLVKVVHSTRDLFPETERDRVLVQVQWDQSEFPGLLETLHALDPTLNLAAS